MDYSSTLEFTTPYAPQVTFKLRKMSHGRRIALNTGAAVALQKISETEEKMRRVEDEIKRAEEAARIEPCSCDHGETVIPEGIKPEDIDPETKHFKVSGACPHLDCHCREPKPNPGIGDYFYLIRLAEGRSTVIVEELYPAYIRWGVASIDGMTIDGAPATVESLLASGSEMIVGELGREVQRIIKMTPEDVLGFKLPSTSGAQTEGQTTDTNAPIVETSDSTKSETVTVITRS